VVCSPLFFGFFLPTNNHPLSLLRARTQKANPLQGLKRHPPPQRHLPLGNQPLPGGPPFDPIDAAIASASSPPFNIIIVVAAGSSGSRVSTMSPARCPSAITVGPIDSSDTRSGFSNYGPEISVFAPGEGILSSFHPGDKGGGDNETAYMSGMSMASPFVAGLAAYVMDLEGSKTPAEMRGVIEG